MGKKITILDFFIPSEPKKIKLNSAENTEDLESKSSANETQEPVKKTILLIWTYFYPRTCKKNYFADLDLFLSERKFMFL